MHAVRLYPDHLHRRLPVYLRIMIAALHFVLKYSDNAVFIVGSHVTTFHYVEINTKVIKCVASAGTNLNSFEKAARGVSPSNSVTSFRTILPYHLDNAQTTFRSAKLKCRCYNYRDTFCLCCSEWCRTRDIHALQTILPRPGA